MFLVDNDIIKNVFLSKKPDYIFWLVNLGHFYSVLLLNVEHWLLSFCWLLWCLFSHSYFADTILTTFSLWSFLVYLSSLQSGVYLLVFSTELFNKHSIRILFSYDNWAMIWFLVLVLVFETGFLCVTTLAILELALVGPAGLELAEILLSLPHECWD